MAQYWGDIEGGTPLTLDVIVNADATAPILYQWFKNGVAIAGAVNSVYNFIAQPDDSHASFTVFVQNPCGDQLSEPVLLGIVSDQPFCKVYSCDAYRTAVLAANPTAYWPMDDGFVYPAGPTIANVQATGDLTNFYSWDGSRPALLLDYCAPTTAYYFSASSSTNQNPATQLRQRDDLTCSGSFFHEGSHSGDSTPWKWHWNLGDVFFTVLYSGTGQLKIIIDGIDGVPSNWSETWAYPGVLPTTPHVLTFTYTELVGFKVWVDFVLVADQAVTRVASNASPDPVFNTAASINSVISEVMFWGDAITDATVQDLKLGFDRNQSTYVDPTPNCIPPP